MRRASAASHRRAWSRSPTSGRTRRAPAARACSRRAVWRARGRWFVTTESPSTAAAAERVLDEWSDLVDELRRTDEANRRGRLAQRHVLEQARQRDRAVLRVIDHVQLLVVGREVRGVPRGVEVEVEASV